jgi:hypothetical protein
MYDRANVAGKANDTWLNTEAAISAGVLDFVALRIAQARRPQQPDTFYRRLADDASDTARATLARAKVYYGLCLWTQRSLPLTWLGETPLVPPLGGLKALMPAYPVGELLVGRGHEVPFRAPPSNSWMADGLNKLAQLHHRFTRYGLAGSLLEAAPLRLAGKFEGEGKLAAAAACMYGAALGRLLLQAPRLALCAAALVNEVCTVVLVGAILMAVSVGLRGLRVALTQAQRLTGADLTPAIDTVTHLLRSFALTVDVQLIAEVAAADIPENDETVDDGSPGRNDRVRNRANVLMRRFGGIEPETADGPAKISRTAEDVATDLRRFCGRHPDAEALKFGLTLVQTFLEATYEPNEYTFQPAELAA